MSGLGEKLNKSETISSSLNKIVEEIKTLSSQVEFSTKPREELKGEFESLQKRFAAVRGRPLYYQYIGTGVGRGPYVELEDGTTKLDLINGIGVHIMGHSHPEVIKAAMKGAMSDILMHGHLQMNQDYVQVSEEILSLAKGTRFKHCWLSTCGTMANENALKIARQKHTPARYVIAMKDAFAGRSTMMAEVTDNPEYKVGLPEYNEVLRVPFYDKNDPSSTQKTLNILKEHIAKHKGNISAFCFEPVLGEGGYKVAPREFFIPLLEECKKNQIAIWADEVQTFLRTGQPFASQTLGFAEYVDICTIAKTVQLGATLYTEDYNPKPGLIAGTFAASGSSLQAGLKIIEILKNNNYFGETGRIKKINERMVRGLNALTEGPCKGKLEDAEGLGLMVAVTPLNGDKEKIGKLLKKLFENGLIAYNCGKSPMRLRFLVPAIISDEEIDHSLEIIKKSIVEFEG